MHWYDKISPKFSDNCRNMVGSWQSSSPYLLPGGSFCSWIFLLHAATPHEMRPTGQLLFGHFPICLHFLVTVDHKVFKIVLAFPKRSTIFIRRWPEVFHNLQMLFPASLRKYSYRQFALSRWAVVCSVIKNHGKMWKRPYALCDRTTIC